MLKEILQIDESLTTVGLSGVIEGSHFHTVFVPFAMSYQPYTLFDDGTHVEVKPKGPKNGRISVFEYKGKAYTYNTQSELWFQAGVVNTLSPQGVQRFLDKESVDPGELYKRVRQAIAKYYDFVLSEELDIVVCHIIHSYMLGVLGKTFYLLLDGERNTGKSTLQNVMSLLQFNGCFSGKSTVASMVRKIHFLRASVNLDEFEKMDKDDKKVVTGILNTGAYASGTREIANLDAKSIQGQIQIFRTFGTKTFSVNRAAFDESFLSRCVVINTARNTRSVQSIYGLSESEQGNFQVLRDDLFLLGLKSGTAMYKVIQAKQMTLDDSGLFGRRGDIIAIICGIKEFCTGDSSSLQSYLMSREELDTEDTNEADRYYLTLKFLVGLLVKFSSNMIEFSNRELLDYLLEELQMEPGFQYAPSARSVGALLKRSKLITSKADRVRQGGSGSYAYRIPTKRVIDLVRRFGHSDLIQMLPEPTFTCSQPHLEANNEV